MSLIAKVKDNYLIPHTSSKRRKKIRKLICKLQHAASLTKSLNKNGNGM